MSLITAENLDKFYKGMQSRSVFSVDFVGADEGDIYTIQSSDQEEEYIGELSESLEVIQTVRKLNENYRISILHGSSEYYTDIFVGKFYGIYEITVNTSLLYSIEVRTPLVKNTYKVGEPFSLEGLAITGNYMDETALDVTEDCVYSIKEGQLISSDDTTLSISYSESGVTKTLSVPITVTSSDIELTATLIAGSTTVTFTNNSIQSGKTLELYTSVDGLDYVSVDVSVANTLTVTYPAQSSNVSVKLVIK